MSIAKPRRIGGIIGSIPRTVSGVYGLTKLSEVDFPFAIGGDTYTYIQDGKYWRCHMFSQVGSDTLTFLRGGLVEYLVVGGGGGGSTGAGGGGGGAGGFSVGTLNAAGSCSVVVGSGGSGGVAGSVVDGQDGGASSLFTVQSAGGGGGGAPGRDGGSGGGGRLRNSAGGSATGAGLGNDGGDSGSGTPTSAQGGGGGGGANSSGGNGSSSAAGAGGSGMASSISGQSLFYAGGGGGGGRTDTTVAAALGGVGGGGSGSQTNTAAENGNANTGGGGGGGGFSSQPSGDGGNGGSGIVIIRYQITQAEFEADEPYYDNVSLLLHMNGSNGSTTFTDSSKHRHTVTANGDAQISTAQSKFGGASAAFDGSGDWLSVPSSSEFSFGTGDFTFECWLNAPIAPPAVNKRIVRVGENNATGNFQVLLLLDQTIRVDTGVSVLISGSTDVVDGAWHHIAVSRNGTALRLFIDGTQDGATVTDTTNFTQTDVEIGADSTVSGTVLNGYIDDLRITKGIARYTGNFTPPQRELLPDILAGITPSGLLDQYTGAAAAYSLRSLSDAYTGPVVTVRRSSDSAEADFTATEVSDGTLEAWCGAGDGLVKTLYDQSGHGRHASQTTATAQPKIVSSGVLVLENGLPAMEFDGTDDSIAASITGLSGFQNMTAACVFSTDTAAAADTGGLMLWSFGKGGTSPRSLFIAQTTGVLSGEYINLGFDNGTARRLGSTSYRRNADESSLLFSTHTQSGTSIFSDGSETSLDLSYLMTTSTAAAPYNTGYTSDDLLTFSALRATGSPTYFSQSKIQELIIYPVDQSANRVAIEDNINSHYNVFDPTVLLLHMDGTNGSTTFTDSSLNNFTVTANGNAQISTAQSKFGGASAAYFDGTGDYLNIASSADFGFGTGDFTIECWIYPSTVSGVQVIADLRASSAGGPGPVLYLNGSTLTAAKNGTTVVLAGGTISTNQWQFVTLTRLSSDWYLSVDGVIVSGPVTDAIDYSGSFPCYVGRNSLSDIQYFNGYIDDLRITKGRALYTANFTPPTQAHPDPVPADPYFNQVSLLLPMDGADGSNTFVDKSLNAFAVTPNGDAAISTTQSKFGGASAYFDGSGDRIYLGDTTTFKFLHAKNDYTLEAWVYPTATNSLRLICGTNVVSPNSGATLRILDGEVGYIIFRGVTGSTTGVFASGLTTNQWTHIAVTVSSTTVRLFINGVLEDSTEWTLAESTANTAYPMSIANDSSLSYGFAGYIDDLRVTKGVARYTANFTPPTAPHPHL